MDARRFLGNTAASLFGTALVGGADIDGDGGPDVVIGGRYTDVTDRGAIYLFSGR